MFPPALISVINACKGKAKFDAETVSITIREKKICFDDSRASSDEDEKKKQKAVFAACVEKASQYKRFKHWAFPDLIAAYKDFAAGEDVKWGAPSDREVVFKDSIKKRCVMCGKRPGKKESGRRRLMKCTGCSSAYYCSKDCQAAHWPEHKHQCKAK